MKYKNLHVHKSTPPTDVYSATSAPLQDKKVDKSHEKANSHNVITANFTRRDFNNVLRLYVVSDIVALALGYLCAWAAAALIDEVGLGRPFIVRDLYPRDFFIISIGVILWFVYTNHYRVRMPFWTEISKILTTFCFAALVDGFLQFALKYDFSRLWLILGWVFAAAFTLVLRNYVRAWLRKNGKFQVKTLFIGSGENARHTRAALRSEPSLGYEIVAQTLHLHHVFKQEGKSWQKLCFAYGADYVIIALDGREMQEAEQLVAQLTRESVPFSLSPPLRHLPLMGMVPQYFFSHDVLLMTCCNKLEQPFSCLIKRAFDVTVAASILLLTSPVLLAIGVLVKRDGGPALYGHMRIGRKGRMFPCLKFRSMIMNGDGVLEKYLADNPQARAEWESTRKLKDDPRVTRLGQFLRKSSLDELPQLLNVLRGDMSLVGPRPIVRDEISNYEYEISHYYNVRPGITGLWQVSGRNDATYAQRVRLDSWYVRNWSLWHDIAILFKTLPAVLNRSGAY